MGAKGVMMNHVSHIIAKAEVQEIEILETSERISLVDIMNRASQKRQ